MPVGIAVLLAGLLMLQYHDVYWYARDEGNYAHVAERIAEGEVLHRDVQDVHPGYINFIHAFALHLFGERLVSLRYPLAFLTVLQAGLVAWVLSRQGAVVAVAGGVVSVVTGVLLFLNPSANWYGLTLTICLIALLAEVPREVTSRAVAAGVVVGVALMFRQLTGAILGAAAFTWAMTASADEAGGAPSPPRLAKVALAVVVAGTAGYVIWGTDAVGWILFGTGPVALGILALLTTRVPDRVALARILQLGFGVAIGVAPMLAYVAVTDSWAGFLENTILAAMDLPAMEQFEQRSYAAYLGLSILAIGTLEPAKMLAGAFWLCLVGAPLLLALTVAGQVRRIPIVAINGGVIVAVFAGLLIAHFPSALYVGAAAPAVLVGILLVCRPHPIVTVVAAGLLVLHVIGWEIGRPRGLAWMMGAHRRIELVDVSGRVGLTVSAREWRRYERVIARIQSRTTPQDAIIALPSRAELYFLAARRNPTTFFSFAQGIRSQAALEALLRDLDATPPRLVIVDSYDPNYSPLTMGLVRWAARKASNVDAVAGMWFFEIPDPGAPP